LFHQEAEKLTASKIHPQTTILGWRKAVKAAQAALEHSTLDNGKDEAKFREDLMNIARTTLSSKILVHQKDHFAKLAVDAVLRLKVLLIVIMLCHLIDLKFCEA
jgi:T-complex protein 1 subunit beta